MSGKKTIPLKGIDMFFVEYVRSTNHMPKIKNEKTLKTNLHRKCVLKSIIEEKERSKKATCSVCFDKDVKELVEQLAEENDVSFSYLVNALLKRIIH